MSRSVICNTRIHWGWPFFNQKCQKCKKWPKLVTPSKIRFLGGPKMVKSDQKRSLFWHPLKSGFWENDHFMDRFTREYILACVKKASKKWPKTGISGMSKNAQRVKIDCRIVLWRGPSKVQKTQKRENEPFLHSVCSRLFGEIVQKWQKTRFLSKMGRNDPKMAKNDQNRGLKWPLFGTLLFPGLGGKYCLKWPKMGQKRGPKSDQKGSFWTPLKSRFWLLHSVCSRLFWEGGPKGCPKYHLFWTFITFSG